MTSPAPTPPMEVADIARAFGLLTRIPLPLDGAAAMARGAQAAWAFPVVGGILGVGFAVLSNVLMWFGLPAELAVLTALVAVTFATGAMHEDALADVLDGFWGGWDKARRLEIMKDSHIGVYGVLGLVFLVGAKVLTYAHVIQSAPLAAVGLFALSRAVMVLVMAFVPNARGTGLSHSVGVPNKRTAWIACGIGGAVAVMTLPILSVLAMVIAAFAMVRLADRKIGGQTGDVLGAVQNISEVAGVITAVCLLA